MYDACSYKDALALLLEDVPLPLACMSDIPVRTAIGRINAEDILSPCAVPRFNTAAMDGYALCSKDVVDADENEPVRLTVQGLVAAGDSPEALRQGRNCVEIMTGAALPQGADAILRVELAELRDGELILHHSIPHGQHVRWSGEDLKQNDLVIPRGRLLGTKELHVLIMLDVRSITVIDIKIGIVSTGSELVSSQEEWSSGNTKVIDSNGPFLKAALSTYGSCTKYEIVSDDVGELKQAFILAASTCDVVVCTGGVSAGKFDFTCRVLEELGKTIFHGVQIKPGRPVLYGKLLCSGRSVDFFGLPGTPSAVAATCRFLLRPFLDQRTGALAEKPLYLPSLHDVPESSHVTSLQRGIRQEDSVRILSHRASISEIMAANCWVMSPAESVCKNHTRQIFATFSE